MNPDPIQYRFKLIEACEFCGASSDKFKVIGKRLNKSQGIWPSRLHGITTSVSKCINCGLVFANPVPIPGSISDHYEINPDEYWKQQDLDNDQGWFVQVLNQFNNWYEGSEVIRSLDVGAGLGNALKLMTSVGFEAYGLEPSTKFYRKIIETNGIEESRVFNTSLESAIFQEEFFDFINFGAVLEHLYSPGKAIVKALGWLKTGGYIYVDVPSSNWLIAKLVNLMYKVRGLDYVTNISPMHPPFHLYEFSLKAFQSHAEKNSYRIEKVIYHGNKPYFKSPLSNLFTAVMKATNTGMQLSAWIKKI